LQARLKTKFAEAWAEFRQTQATDRRADDILRYFMSELLKVRKMLWTDIDAAYEGDPAAQSYEEIILAYPALEAIAIYRMAHLLTEGAAHSRIMTEWAQQPHRNRYSPRGKDWLAFFYRSRHWCRDRRDDGDRRAR
jgi:serine O-acetyltransferase